MPVDHLPQSVEVVFADIRDRRRLARGVAWGAMGLSPGGESQPVGAVIAANSRRSIIAGTVNVLDAALAAGASRMLHTSTESILTKAQASGPIDENIEISLSDAVGPYCRSKLLAEQYAFLLARQGRRWWWPIRRCRWARVIRNLSPPTRLILDFCRGALPAIMDCTLNLIDVRDVARGLRLVMEHGADRGAAISWGTPI